MMMMMMVMMIDHCVKILCSQSHRIAGILLFCPTKVQVH